MLSPIRRPSRIAATIVAKSSSVSTIAAASRAASVPDRPIATPTSARRSAGASLTPSPVTATTSPCAWSSSTSASFDAGVARATMSVVGEPERVADRARGRRVVAGEHANGDAGVARLVDRRGGGRPQRVVKRDEPEQLELGLDRVVERRSRRRAGARRRRARGSPPRPRRRRARAARGRRDGRASATTSGAPFVNARRPSGLVVDDRHALALGVERHLVHGLAPARAALSAGEPALHRREQQRRLDRVADDVSVVGRPRRRREHRRLEELALVDAASRAQGGDADLVLGQRAGLVGADDGRLAERLDRVERRTIAPRRASARAPSASAAVTVAASPSGTAATATATPTRNAACKRLALQQHRARRARR